ncbi:MAG: hypothetical protein IPH94_04360 [Saprospiraceae bacterium]|nr:hypothetical protein [Saprospiraceae bacterium]MBK7220587.1 hypothetical protein [Saprospiraceae bacterium]MBK7790783.1 hypothetical protein [Saprospiraceae bacterium]MBK8109370.1 hypothetical protein [Saprospiraceae bacterium]MBK9689314.1 hypothetical protein [Saprospiraceae bacterium]
MKNILKLLVFPFNVLIIFACITCNDSYNDTLKKESINAENRTVQCGPVFGDCSSTFTTYRSNIPVIIEQCTVLVSYNLDVCFDDFDNAKSVIFTNMEYEWGVGCDSIRNSWSDLYIQGFYSTLNTQMNAFYNSISIQIENLEAANFTLFPCPSSGNPCTSEYSAFEFYVSDCFKRCAVYDEREDIFNLIEVKCGDACCRRITQVCYTDGVIYRCPTRLVSNYGAFACSGEVADGACLGILFGNCLNPCERVN